MKCDIIDGGYTLLSAKTETSNGSEIQFNVHVTHDLWADYGTCFTHISVVPLKDFPLPDTQEVCEAIADVIDMIGASYFNGQNKIGYTNKDDALPNDTFENIEKCLRATDNWMRNGIMTYVE